MRRIIGTLGVALLVVSVAGLSGCLGGWGHAPYKSKPYCGMEFGHGHQYNRVDSDTGYSSQALCTEDGCVVPCTKDPPKRKPCTESHHHQYDYGCGHDTIYRQRR